MQVETEGYDLYAVAAYPMSENAGLFAKIGFASWNTETEVNDTNETHHKSTDLALSIGETDFRLSSRLPVYMSKASATAAFGCIAALADVCGEKRT